MKQESLEMFLECCLATSTINIVVVIIIIIIIIITDCWADHSAPGTHYIRVFLCMFYAVEV